MFTPHIKPINSDSSFAKTVLMPGDPLRSKFIAETFLEKAELINNVRGIQGYTGFYKDKPVSVMASGMGMPSMGIYSYELFKFFGVENIIRIGTAGAISPKLELRDIVFAMGSCTNSSYANQFGLNGTIAPIADYELLSTAVGIAEKEKLNYKVGNLYSSDTFYDMSDTDGRNTEKWRNLGVLAVEMESAALYLNAMNLHKRALAICTISDIPGTDKSCTPEERQLGFTDMMKVALEIAISFD